MVRFARARGSKAANQKTPEEATSWRVMREQLLETKGVQKERSAEEEEEGRTNWKKVVETEEMTKLNQNSTWAEFDEDEGQKKKKKSTEGAVKKRKKKKLVEEDPEEKTEDEVKKKEENVEENNMENSVTEREREKKKKREKNRKKREKQEFKRRKPDPGDFTLHINGRDINIVRFEGFYVKKEDAIRIAELRKKLNDRGVSRKEIELTVKGERRKAEKTLAREKKKVCFHCRLAGHNLSDCPQLSKPPGDHRPSAHGGAGICYKCGSTEHSYFQCRAATTNDNNFSFATCFICKEEGHIAKQCPDNPRGLYPKGGACRLCGDVTHLKRDCPGLLQEKAEARLTLDILDSHPDTLHGGGDNHTRPSVLTQPNRPNKIIKF